MFELVKSGDAASDGTDGTRGTLTKWQETFLKVLRKTPSVTAACRAARVARQTAYVHRKENKLFAELWRDAIETSIDDLEATAFKLATEGDSSLISFLLRCHRPEIYRDISRHEVAVGGVVFLPEKKAGDP